MTENIPCTTINCSWTNYNAHFFMPNGKIKRCRIVGFDWKHPTFILVEISYQEKHNQKWRTATRFVSPLSIAALDYLMLAGLAVSDDDVSTEAEKKKTLPPLQTTDFPLIPSNRREEFLFTLNQTNNLLFFKLGQHCEKVLKLSSSGDKLLPTSWDGHRVYSSGSGSKYSVSQCIVKGFDPLHLALVTEVVKKPKPQTVESPWLIIMLEFMWMDKLIVSSSDEEEEEQEYFHHDDQICLGSFEVYGIENLPENMRNDIAYITREINFIVKLRGI
jgi:hypothetical protein